MATIESSVAVIDSFDDMGMDERVLRGIYSHGFERPSAIQQRAIVPLMQGRDTIAQAQSGTGKSGAFLVGCLNRIDYARRECQALVVAPTRELAVQTHRVGLALGDYCKVACHVCVGGTDPRVDAAKLRQGQHLVVGTPGRLNDMVKRGHLSLAACRLFVLDEADEMLDRGFQDQIYELFKQMPQDVQVGLFSATMSPETIELSRKFLRDPVRILVKEEELTLEGIQQFYIALDCPSQRVPCLVDLYETMTITQAMIFCNTRRTVDDVYAQLTAEDFTCSCIHADLDWSERELIMREFKSGSSRILISTDLLAKGIDVQQVSLVVNYDLPLKVENYLHRIGRGGRFGRKGVAVNFVTERSVRALKEIERHYVTQIQEMPQDVANLL